MPSKKRLKRISSLSNRNKLSQRDVNNFLRDYLQLKSNGVESIKAINILQNQIGKPVVQYFAVIGIMEFCNTMKMGVR